MSALGGKFALASVACGAALVMAASSAERSATRPVAASISAPSAAPDPVVSVAWLAQHLKDRDLVILQVGSPAEYDAGHIPNAHLIDPRNSSTNFESASDEAGAMPSEALLHGRFLALGISDNSNVVVVFGSAGLTMATRSLFLLRYGGVERAVVLDGGLAAWKKASLTLSTAAPVITPGRFTGHNQSAYAVDAAWVQAHLHAPHYKIIDAREPVYYSAPMAMIGMAAGHLPGAHNVPFNSLVDDAGLLRTASALETTFRNAGVQPGDTVVAYCHVGLQATTVVLGARRAGITALMYTGSFHDWTARKLPTEVDKP